MFGLFPRPFGLVLGLVLTLALGTPPMSRATSGARFDAVSIEEGLMQSTVYAIAQAPDGLIYLGTERGAASFDGYRFRPIDVPGLADQVVSVLHIDLAGGLFLGTFSDGLVRFDLTTQTFRTYRHDPRDETTLGGSGIRALEAAGPHRLWVGTGAGVDLLDLETGRAERMAATRLATAGVLALEVDRAGILWIGTDGEGLARFDPVTGDLRRFRHDPANPASLPSDVVLAVVQSQRGDLFVGTRRGLARLDGERTVESDQESGHFEIHRAGQGLSHDTARALFEDSAGLIWISTASGLNVLDPKSGLIQHFQHDPTDPTSPADDNVRTVFEDASGLLWIGTVSAGALRYDRAQHRFNRLGLGSDPSRGLSNGFVWAVHVDPDGTLWAGTAGDGLDRFDARGAQAESKVNYRHHSKQPGSLASDHVTALHRDRSGVLWVGTADGEIDRLEEDSGLFIHYGKPPHPAASVNPIRSILEDRFGDLWVASWGTGLNRLDRKQGIFEAFPKNPSPDGTVASTMLEDNAGGLWIATYGGGLHTLDPDRRDYRIYRHDPEDTASLASDWWVSMALGRDGHIWLGSNDGELARFDPQTGRSTLIQWSDGGDLSGLSLYTILEDHRQRLWLATNRGLVRFVPATGEARRFDSRDGLQSTEFNAGAAFRLPSSGELFFGGIHGLDRFHPDAVTELAFVPPVVLTSVRRLNQEMPLDRSPAALDSVEFSYRDRYLSFEFAALDYRDPRKNRYAFMLEGQDEDWIDAGTRNLATYTNLRGGEYVLRVRGSNSDGVWNNQGLRLSVRVLPPFWDTLWFRVGSASLLLGAAFLLPVVWYRRLLRQLARRQTEERETRRRLLEAREKERIRVARELHDGPLQDLYGLGLKLRQDKPQEGEPQKDEHQSSHHGELQRIAGNLRGLCGELRSPGLAQGGLSAAMEAYTLRFTQAHPEIQVELDLMRDDGPVDSGHNQLFRIFQEALRNVAHHATASRVTVRLDVDAEGNVLEVADDGIGFEVPERLIDLGRNERYGLLGMAERAELLGGRLELKSITGGGTLVRAEIPPTREVRPL